MRQHLQFLILACVGSLASGLSPAQTASAPRPVTSPQAEVRTLVSPAMNADVDVYIHFPDGYDTTTTKLPVLFVLDGENDFGPTQEYLGLLGAEYGIRQPLLVAIGEGGPIGSSKNNRGRDFTPPTAHPREGSGGAPSFLKFIETELIPFIEKTYQADPTNRTLYGYSLGGLFATYALFNQPKLFKNILIGSPALGYDNEKMLEVEAEYAKTHTDLPVNVFLEVGSEEGPGMIEPNKKLAQNLRSRNYKNLRVERVVLEKANHYSGKPIAMYQALAYAYGKPVVKRASVSVPAKVLQTYPGVYQIKPELTVAITTKGGKLFALPSDQKYPIELAAISETEFQVEREEALITFVKNNKNQVTHFVLHQRGQKLDAKKIK